MLRSFGKYSKHRWFSKIPRSFGKYSETSWLGKFLCSFGKYSETRWFDEFLGSFGKYSKARGFGHFPRSFEKLSCRSLVREVRAAKKPSELVDSHLQLFEKIVFFDVVNEIPLRYS